MLCPTFAYTWLKFRVNQEVIISVPLAAHGSHLVLIVNIVGPTPPKSNIATDKEAV